MNREEAKLLLDATTLRPQDADAEAHALAQSDPALHAWVEQRAAFDEKVAAVLQETPVPVTASVHENLLRAMQAEAAKVAGSQASPRVHPAKWKRSWTMLAAAALIAVLAYPGMLLVNYLIQPKAEWQGEALAKVQLIEHGMLPLEHRGPSVDGLKPLLASAGAVMPGELPATLTRTKTFGCRVIQVAGKPATVVCFKLGAGKEAHLVVMNQQTTGKVEGTREQPLYASRDGWQTATWSDGVRTYLLATLAEAEALKKLLAQMEAGASQHPTAVAAAISGSKDNGLT